MNYGVVPDGHPIEDMYYSEECSEAFALLSYVITQGTYHPCVLYRLPDNCLSSAIYVKHVTSKNLEKLIKRY